MRKISCLFGMLISCVSLPLTVGAEGFGPFPVRNFQALDQLVLAMPGERAAVLKKGDFDVRLEVANTASIARDQEEQADATMKFETVRAGLFLRYGLTDRLEIGAEIPGYHRHRGFMEEPILGVERGTTGMAPARKALGKQPMPSTSPTAVELCFREPRARRGWAISHSTENISY